MKKRFCFILLVIFTMAGCKYEYTARLYPVQGPLSAQTPSQVVFAKITVAFKAHEFAPIRISVALDGGEICKGNWEQAPVTQIPKAAATNVPMTGEGMSSVWDSIYGQGFYLAHVLGTRHLFRAVASGNRGAVLNLEVYWTESEHADIKGVARDNRGNVFKLIL